MEMAMLDTFGQRLREARTSAGLTLQELADRVKTSRQAVQQWENDVIPNWCMGCRLVRALGLDYADLDPEVTVSG